MNQWVDLLENSNKALEINPHFLTGKVKCKATYILCSDGFRHTVTSEELLAGFSREKMLTESDIEKQCKYFVELNKSRQERDNISVIVAHLEE